jgi:predicted HicB family RNase H-like nuclease
MAPNKPRTPVSNFRIPPDLKTRAQTKAAEEGKTLTAVILNLLREYIQEPVEQNAQS